MGVVTDTALVRRGKGARRRMGRRTCVAPSNEQTKQPVGVVREIRRPNPPENRQNGRRGNSGSINSETRQPSKLW